MNFFLIFGVFRPFAAPSKCRPVRPAPTHPRRYATDTETDKHADKQPGIIQMIAAVLIICNGQVAAPFCVYVWEI